MADHEDTGAPGAVAFAIAYAVAVHQQDTPQVLVDPVAERLVGMTATQVAAMMPGGREFRSDLRLALAAYCRFADDVATAAVTSGTAQLVVLDAGLDTTCYRRPYPGVRLFEVDQRGLLSWKRRRLAVAGVDIPTNMTYVPLDDDGQLCASLRKAGYDADRSTVAIWLQTTFLTQRRIADAFAWFGAHRGPIEIVFDYTQPPEILPQPARDTVTTLVAEMARAGEPMLSFAALSEIDSTLRELGFHVVEDLSLTDLLERYAPTHADAPDTLGGRVVHATRTRRDSAN